MVDILDFQLQWYWVWVLQMVSSYSVMAFQRKVWTKQFQLESTTTGRFMTDSIITLHLILVAHILIYFPLPLMIDPDRIKDPAIPQISFQLPSLLPLKILVVILPPLIIRHDSLSLF